MGKESDDITGLVTDCGDNRADKEPTAKFTARNQDYRIEGKVKEPTA